MQKADEERIREKYGRITDILIQNNETITTMESCTAGLIASLITDREGSSAAFRGALVTYSNEVKIQHGVSVDILNTYGVYSVQTACEMARTARRVIPSDYSIAVTGTFGNADPENADSVPGEVFYAVDSRSGTRSCHLSVPVQTARYAYKWYMADAIADTVLALLAQDKKAEPRDMTEDKEND